MNSRVQNERKFRSWEELPGGGRRYWLDVLGRLGWRARYLKEVVAQEVTLLAGDLRRARQARRSA
jgi:hypothetical protein